MAFILSDVIMMIKKISSQMDNLSYVAEKGSGFQQKGKSHRKKILLCNLIFSALRD